MVCPQCSAITDKGKRCKRNTCIKYPLCWQHMKTKEGLELKKSEIPDAGQGVFATRDFPYNNTKKGKTQNKPITYYSAKKISNKPNPNSAYVLRVNDKEYLDSENPSNFSGKYINSFRNHPDVRKRYANVRFGASQRIYRKNDRFVVPILQKKTIKKGDELYLNYGKMYPFENN